MTAKASAEPVPRLVLLGASNLSGGLPSVLAAARRELGEGPFAVFMAAGPGRSYGAPSRFLARGLPGIADCGLWRAVAASPPGPLFALATDVGNDLVYGSPPSRVAGWVAGCAHRLIDLGARLVLTRLPLASLRRLGPLRFRLIKGVLFPGRPTLTYCQALVRAEELDGLLDELARRIGAMVVEPSPSWYGFDTIHLRRGARDAAWASFLAPWGGASAASGAARDPLPALPRRVRTVAERSTLFGIERRHRQPCARLADGTAISLF